jgi:hypothetical protein
MRMIALLALVLFCSGCVFSSGCVSPGNSVPPATSPGALVPGTSVTPAGPEKIITPSAPAAYRASANTTGSDPFIGFWWTLEGGRASHRVYPNGNITSVFGDFGGLALNGNWTKTGENTYSIEWVDPPMYAANATAVYYPGTDTVIDSYAQKTLRRITDYR